MIFPKIFSFLLIACLLLDSAESKMIFGVATAALQIEGAWLQDGKSPSVWDHLAHQPGFIEDGTTPEIASDSYNRYKEDIDLIKAAGIKHYRMSLSWPRIVPQGRSGTKINMKAIERYTDMFKYMEQQGITPYVTLYHWDLPAVLAIRGYGLIDPFFEDDFVYYANASFFYFGKYVKNWYTINEPWCVCMKDVLKKREKPWKAYNISYHILMAHARTVDLYRKVYKEKENGVIGIVLNTDYFYPKDKNNPQDIEAASRGQNFSLGWFADPVFFGDYPEIMRQRVGDRLPKFNETEKKLLAGSLDFLGINHYTSGLYQPGKAKTQHDYYSDVNVTKSFHKDWNFTDVHWPIVPEGIHDLLVLINKRYMKTRPVPIYITENGMANKETTFEEAMNDQPRIHYLKNYIANVQKAADEGVDIRGYFTWSLLDNFEWAHGLSKRFGIIRVNYGPNPTRHPKASYYWYRDFIKSNSEADS